VNDTPKLTRKKAKKSDFLLPPYFNPSTCQPATFDAGCRRIAICQPGIIKKVSTGHI
jgi:hypothetical protein